LDEGYPFSKNALFWEFDYWIKPQTNNLFKVSEIIIEGKYSGGWCKCYQNKVKKIVVNKGVISV
jgi:hypothetical protein